MKPKRFPPDDPREWLRRAKSNLDIATAFRPDVDLADLCFDAQQAAEKGIKAVFVLRGANFPFIHDLKRLLDILQEDGTEVPKYMRDVKELTRYAYVTRYPGEDSEVTKRQYRRAVRIATAALRWAERHVSER